MQNDADDDSLSESQRSSPSCPSLFSRELDWDSESTDNFEDEEGIPALRDVSDSDSEYDSYDSQSDEMGIRDRQQLQSEVQRWSRVIPEERQKIVDALEEVSLERATEGGKDSGCAICLEMWADEGNDASESRKIVSLPCAHLFHNLCVAPWLSEKREPTCPVCIFNLDPEGHSLRPQLPEGSIFFLPGVNHADSIKAAYLSQNGADRDVLVAAPRNRPRIILLSHFETTAPPLWTSQPYEGHQS